MQRGTTERKERKIAVCVHFYANHECFQCAHCACDTVDLKCELFIAHTHTHIFFCDLTVHFFSLVVKLRFLVKEYEFPVFNFFCKCNKKLQYFHSFFCFYFLLCLFIPIHSFYFLDKQKFDPNEISYQIF